MAESWAASIKVLSGQTVHCEEGSEFYNAAKRFKTRCRTKFNHKVHS